MKGSEHNDMFVAKNGKLGTATNRSGGVQGGITNGEPIVFRVPFKPTATIGKVQKTADYSGNIHELAGKGRHDPCILPRAVPVVEAMASLVLADMARLNSHE
jgi:chorismate synthase